jgi:hypothetical protein
MIACPLCLAPNPDDARCCRGCDLPSDLFSAIRGAAGPDLEQEHTRAVTEVLASLETTEGPGRSRTGSGGPAQRSPVPPAPRHKPSIGNVNLPTDPVGMDDLFNQLDGLAALGRRLGLDTDDAELDAYHAYREQSRSKLRAVRTRLFRVISEMLLDRQRFFMARRVGIARPFSTADADIEIHRFRRALTRGDLTEAAHRLRQAHLILGDLERRRTKIDSLVFEVRDMAHALVRLGGDPKAAIAPVVRMMHSPGQHSHSVMLRILTSTVETLRRQLISQLTTVGGRRRTVRPAVAMDS